MKTVKKHRNKKYTFQEVKDYIEKYDYNLLSTDYQNISAKIKLRCPLGHEYETTFASFKNKGSRCPYCKGCHKYTIEEIKQFVESCGYELLSDEYNPKEKIKLKCPMGHEWEVSFLSFKNGSVRCNYCHGNIKFTYEYVKKYVESRGFILISKEYKRAREKIEIECQKCGYRFSPTFDSFKNKNTGCPSCLGVKKYTHQDVKEYMENFGYELLSEEYNNCREKMKIKCPYGHIFKMNFDTFKNKGCRCNICNESKGERRISEYLEKYNISFDIQKTFSDLLGMGGGHLSYDFYLPDYNLLIEYQGGFHDGTVTGSYQKLYDLERQQIHDKIKEKYAEQHNIRLLEIWYWDYDNIENILDEVLNDGR